MNFRNCLPGLRARRGALLWLYFSQCKKTDVIFNCQSTKAHPVFGVPGNESTPMTTSGLLTCRRIPAPGGQRPPAFPSGDMQQSNSRFLKCTVLIAPSWESPPIGCTDFGCPQMPVSLSAKGAENQKSCTFRCNFFCFGDDSTVFRR